MRRRNYERFRGPRSMRIEYEDGSTQDIAIDRMLEHKTRDSFVADLDRHERIRSVTIVLKPDLISRYSVFGES